MRVAVPLGVGSALLVLLASGCAYLPALPGWRSPEAPEPPPLVSTPPVDLPAPEGLRATSGEHRAIPLQWDPLLSVDIGGYRLERAERREGPFTPLPPIWGRGVIARVDRGGEETPLSDGVTRFYRIRAFSPEGRISANASEVAVGTTAPLPGPPEGLRAYSHQPREVPLAWRASDEAHVAGYAVERSPSPDGPFEVVAELEGRHATSYVDSGLGDLRVFYYRVAARNPSGESGAASDAVRAVTKPAPLPPFGVQVEARRLGVNVLSWTPNVERDIEAYRLYRIGSDGARELVASVPADRTRAEDPGVAAGATSVYVLVAVDRDGLASRPSRRIEVTGERYDLRAEARADAVVLRWNPRSDEGFVRARVERDGWLGRRPLGTSETGEFVDRDVRPGGRYRYVAVLERPDAEEAPPSLPVDVRVPETAEIR